jgi:rhodanese-related sulfurtransferase
VRCRAVVAAAARAISTEEFTLDATQLILYGVLAVVILLYARRMLLMRSLKHYTPPEIAEKLKTNVVILLDVRTAMERQRSSINGSVHIPLHELRTRANELKKYKGKEIVCFCASGNRSISAAATLNKLGFSAANMKGGIAEWRLSGLR